MRTAWIGLLLALGACFDGEELTEGLPCRKNGDCGGAQLCIDFICGEEDEPDVGGNPCEIGGNVCVDANTLGICDLDSQMTMAIPCDDRCESSGYGQAIGCRTTMSAKHDCYCDLSTLSCDTATYAPTCNGGVLTDCDDGELDVTDCEELCQESGQAGNCEQTGTDPNTGAYLYGCVCTAGSCYEGATFCQDDNTQALCVSGVWQLQPCTDGLCDQSQCPEFSGCPEDYEAQSLGCGYDGSSNTGCRCTI